jgi:secreted PhoX family phosphatase
MPDHPKGQGKWIELTHGKNGIDASNGFANQAEVLIHARMAASVVKATRMDRPEWIVVSPKDGQVYCTLTNNAKRGEDGQPVGGPNPRAKNQYGQILRWQETGSDAASMAFAWDLFVVAGNPGVHAGTPQGGSSNITPQNMFNSPDGLGFDKAGRLWILTDGDYSNAVISPEWATIRCFAPIRPVAKFVGSWSGRLAVKSPASVSRRTRKRCSWAFSIRGRKAARPFPSICPAASRGLR